METLKVYEYSSNNSGGSWWLKKKDWEALEKAGWKVKWGNGDYTWKNGNHVLDEKGYPLYEKSDSEWLGTPAKTAWFKAKTLDEAVSSFEEATSESVDEVGCPCCGEPHSISEL